MTFILQMMPVVGGLSDDTRIKNKRKEVINEKMKKKACDISIKKQCGGYEVSFLIT